MKVSNKIRKLIESNKKNLITEKDAYELWKETRDNNRFNWDEQDDITNIFISSGVHIEKYMTQEEIGSHFIDIDFYEPVALFFDSIKEIDYGYTMLHNLSNVREMVFNNCESITVNRIGCKCPDLTRVALPKCEYLHARMGSFDDCPSLVEVEHPQDWEVEVQYGSDLIFQ